MEIVLALFALSVVFRVVYVLWRNNRKIQDDYRKSDAYRRTREKFIDEIRKRGKK